VQVTRVLDEEPVRSLAAHTALGGGLGLVEARRLGPDAVIDRVAASGLRGRGGAGFPTGTKWRTVRSFAADAPTTVVVNAAEGEPGSFKDRAIIRANPYRVLEGALIAALALGADRVIAAVKATFSVEASALRRAVAEFEESGWTDGVAVEVVEGPGEYLFGEETGLLEVLDGRAPFPRVAPPWRHGADELGYGTESAASLELATPGGVAPPTLVNNTETFANVPGIIADGPGWFRDIGTEQSPGTVVCTVSGDTRRHTVVELAMGTPLRYLLERVGGGARRHRHLVAAISGVANPFVPADLFDAPLSHEGMAAVGSGLGAAGFLAFDDDADLVAVTAGIARFLAVESCGQCTPCKQDGLAIAEILGRLAVNDGAELDLLALADHVGTVATGARCYLAQQQETVVASALRLFDAELRAHATGAATPVEVRPIVPMVEVRDDESELDLRELDKQPDWTFDPIDSHQSPADRIDQRAAGR
jgi:NADH:ubiquinone oxidoreductase subunit F (NADH-binding)